MQSRIPVQLQNLRSIFVFFFKPIYMRLFVLFLLSIVFITTSFAQVGIGTPTPASSAALDISSSTKGFLPPRLTTEQIKKMVAPVEGLIVYNLTMKKPCFYNGTRWNFYDTTYVLPEIGGYWPEGGGIVIYMDATGLHGIIAASEDQSATAIYGCLGLNITGAVNSAIGTGQANTNVIMAACGTPGLAASICDALVLNGKSDWYLPSRDELHLMFQYIQGPSRPVGTHISSTQNDANSVWMESGNLQFAVGKDQQRALRAVRSF
ncbi:MAG: hypothetical protein V4717_06250 [Bacteroidota bacterium]